MAFYSLFSFSIHVLEGFFSFFRAFVGFSVKFDLFLLVLGLLKFWIFGYSI